MRCPLVHVCSGSWKTASFKPFNLRSLGADIGGGHLHLLMKMRAEYRKILLEMGCVHGSGAFVGARVAKSLSFAARATVLQIL